MLPGETITAGMNPPVNLVIGDDQPVVLVGLMGAGKSAVGEPLARRLDCPFYDGDDELIGRVGVSPATLAERDGTAELHAAEAAVLLDLLDPPHRCVIAASASTIEDPRCREALRDAFVVWLQADPAFLAPRASDNGKRPVPGDVEGQLREQEARRAPLFAEVADERFDVAVTPLEAITDELAAALTAAP
jgi:shikimate kinase